jgi:hypothetical protein
MAPLEVSLRFLEDTDLTESEREQVMGGNAARVPAMSSRKGAYGVCSRMRT